MSVQIFLWLWLSVPCRFPVVLEKPNRSFCTYLEGCHADGHEPAPDVGDRAHAHERQQGVHTGRQGVQDPARGVDAGRQHRGQELDPHGQRGVAVLGSVGAGRGYGRYGGRGQAQSSMSAQHERPLNTFTFSIGASISSIGVRTWHGQT